MGVVFSMKIQSTQDLGSAFQEGKTFHPLYEDSAHCDLAKLGLELGLGLGLGLRLGLGLLPLLAHIFTRIRIRSSSLGQEEHKNFPTLGNKSFPMKTSFKTCHFLQEMKVFHQAFWFCHTT